MRLRHLGPAALVAVVSAVGADFHSTWGLDVLGAILQEKQNIALRIDDWQLEGFERDLFSEYRADSVIRRTPAARIAATVPVNGAYYPAFVIYDGSGDEQVEVRVAGRVLGTAAASLDDNRQRMFFFTEPRSFRAGDIIELRALNAAGAYRTESILLLKERPEAGRHRYAITHFEARREPAGVMLTWITNWPSAGTVEWEGEQPGRRTEASPENNHRVGVEGLRLDASYSFRVTAKSPTGDTVASAWQTLETKDAPAVRRSAEKGQVRLQLGNPVEETKPWSGPRPVTSGLPFPKGVLGTDQQLRLLNASAQELPLQARVLGRWQDGSVKWALLDFQRISGESYTIEYGSEVSRRKASSPLSVSNVPDSISVVTGPLKVVIDKRRFELPGTVSLDMNRNGTFEDGERVTAPGAIHLEDERGVRYVSLAKPEEVAVEESGPMRAVIRVKGPHVAADGRKLFSYTLRMHFFAGQPYVRLQHTFLNDASESEFTIIKSLVLSLKFQRPGKAASALRVVQHRDDGYSVSRGGATSVGQRADGVGSWTDGERSLTLALRDFWQNYPKQLTVTPEGIELGLCPAIAKDEYADAKGTIDEHRLYYYLQGGGYKLRQGVSKTHDIWINFAAGEAAEAPPLAPLRALAPADWYASSKALGELAPTRSTGILAEYDTAFAGSFAAYLKNRETNREYGMLNFGDWWGEREINWGNSEYDTQHAFLLQFARTGDWRYFRAAEEMEWHNRDVDTVHFHQDTSRVGGVYLHCVGHTGDYYTESPVKPPKGIPGGRMSVSHTFIEGHLNYYFFTGDPRSLETARRTADRHDIYETQNYDFTNCRNPGWHLILTMAMYNATNEPFYLNAARIIVERVLERQTSDGGWRRQLVPGHCTCMPRHHGNAGFMVGILLTGLRHYYEATQDERAARSIERAAHFLIDDMWLPEIDGFRYTSCPKSFTGAWSNFLLFDGIVFAHQRTKDAKLREVLYRGTPSALKSMTGWGKGFTQYTRETPRFLGYLTDLREGQPASR